jgi:hypothetical protein
MRKLYKIFIEKSDWKRPLWKTSCRWEDNIKVDLKDMLCEVVDWILLARNRSQSVALVNRVMNLGVP